MDSVPCAQSHAHFPVYYLLVRKKSFNLRNDVNHVHYVERCQQVSPSHTSLAKVYAILECYKDDSGVASIFMSLNSSCQSKTIGTILRDRVLLLRASPPRFELIHGHHGTQDSD